MSYIILILFVLHVQTTGIREIYLPIDSDDQSPASSLQLTDIGQFGLLRTARLKIPAHYHTGIDIKRPSNNYKNEFIYPIAPGKVISKRSDGAYAQLIIEHSDYEKMFWTVYEHIAGIMVAVNDSVFPAIPVARFMNEGELNQYGWQFDHLHFEILKVKPIPLKSNIKTPERYYAPYSLICFTKQDLYKYYYNPIEFLFKK